MSKQNIAPFDRSHAEITKMGDSSHLNEDFQLILQQNFQFLRKTLSEDGNLTPGRSEDDLDALSTEQYTGRYAYNNDTHNAMTNIEGIYRNITTTLPLSHPAPLNPHRHEMRTGKNGEVYHAVQGELKQSVLSKKEMHIELGFDGASLILEINGKRFRVALTEEAEANHV